MGNKISPAVAVMPKTRTTLVYKRFEATRHILNRMPSSMKGIETVVFCIILVFYEVYQVLGKAGAFRIMSFNFGGKDKYFFRTGVHRSGLLHVYSSPGRIH